MELAGGVLKVASTYISVGSTVSGTGAIRLPNNVGIYFRDAANANDRPLIRAGSDNTVRIWSNAGATEATLGIATADASGHIGPSYTYWYSP